MPHRDRGWRTRLAGLLCLALLSACAGHHGRVATRAPAPGGGGSDQWAGYIREASGRFGVPEAWIRAVMQQESGGRQFVDGQQTTSSAGAMGLMQVVPDTYAGLRDRYGLGGDPYDPHDNIMAGTAYIREMYDRFGAPGFLAAYNAGPRRLESFLDDGTPLPAETVRYLASVAPRLGPETRMTGPLAAYAGRSQARYAAAEPPALPPVQPTPVQLSPIQLSPIQLSGVQPSPERLPPPEPEAVAAAPAYQPRAPEPRPPEPRPPEPRPPEPRAYEAPAFQPQAASALAPPPRPRTSPPAPPAPPAFVPAPFVAPPVVRASARPREEQGAWAIQVGAFTTPGLARDAADAARQRLAGRGETTVGVAAKPGGGVLFRARVTGLTADSARAGCARVAAGGAACIIVSPESS